MATHFHTLKVLRIAPDAAGSAVITLAAPEALREAFSFQPGQFLTVRATIDGVQTRRSYSICSPRDRYQRAGELDIGVKPQPGGVFSRWATSSLRAGDALESLPPDGRFTPRVAGARRRAGFAAGSGITPILSIIATTLTEEPASSFTLVYGNQRAGSIMFSEALADLKDRFPARLSLIHLLSRQPHETPLLQGRLDADKVDALLRTLVPPDRIDEAFVCGPEGMIEATHGALLRAGLAPQCVHVERFNAGGPQPRQLPAPEPQDHADARATIALDVVLDGKTYALRMGPQDKVLDVALQAGLDLPYSCRAGVCCACRARVLEGQASMERNYGLEPEQALRGFVLTCQARPLGPRLRVSYDER